MLLHQLAQLCQTRRIGVDHFPHHDELFGNSLQRTFLVDMPSVFQHLLQEFFVMFHLDRDVVTSGGTKIWHVDQQHGTKPLETIGLQISLDLRELGIRIIQDVLTLELGLVLVEAIGNEDRNIVEPYFSSGLVGSLATYQCLGEHTWFGPPPSGWFGPLPSTWIEVPENLILRPYKVLTDDFEPLYQKELVELGLVQDVYGDFYTGTVLYLQSDRTGKRYTLLIGDMTAETGSCRHCPYDFSDDPRILAFWKLDAIEPPKLSYEG